MAEKKITRKVISKVPLSEGVKKVSPPVEDRPAEEKVEGVIRAKRACFFCQSKTNPSYTDINTLRHSITDRAKIVLRAKSNLCSKHQRVMTRHVKYARHLALLPFTPKV